MGEEGGHRPRPMGNAVLLRHRHLREGLPRSLRDENRIESEAAGSSLAGRDRPAALPVEDVVGFALPKEEHGLERRGTGLCVLQELQKAWIPESLLDVRGVHAGKSAERVQEQARVVNQVVSSDLVVEDRRGETHDLLEAVLLDLWLASIFADYLHSGFVEHRVDLTVHAFMCREVLKLM